MKRVIILVVFIFFFTNCKRVICLKEIPLQEMKEGITKENPNFEFINSLKEFSLTFEEEKLLKELIKKAFDKFNSNLKRSERHTFKKLPDLRKYNFLFTPASNKENDKLLFIKGYLSIGECEDLWTLDDWYGVSDGGNSFIQFVINLTKETTSYIMPNGEA